MDNSTPQPTSGLQGLNPFPDAVQQNQATPTPEDTMKATENALDKKRKDQEQQYNQAAISQAMAILHPNDNNTQVQVGKANATPGYAYSGLCLKWVDDQTGNTKRQPTAIADYQARAQAGDVKTSSDNIPDNARVYFSPSEDNGFAGHVGIYNAKNNTFTSATDSGIKSFTIPEWEKYTNQKFIGWSK